MQQTSSSIRAVLAPIPFLVSVVLLALSTGIGIAEPLTGVTRISAGGGHTCVVNGESQVACWGFNRFGQLGTGNSEDQREAKFTRGLEDMMAPTVIDAVVAGGAHSCALASNGGVWCWGSNTNGQLAMDTGVATVALPAPARGVADVLSLKAGALHTCVLDISGGVSCWGLNHDGQLGNGSTTDSDLPVMVAALGPVLDIHLGGVHSCATTLAGGARCWGDNEYGQLGDGSLDDASTPVDVVGLAGPAIALAPGLRHSCALLADGTVQCWGFPLGPIPITVPGFANIVQIASGATHVCGVDALGGVFCAGANSSGQLGDGTSDTRLMAVGVIGLDSGVVMLDAGGTHTCALAMDGQVACWGSDSSGQLGVYGAGVGSNLRRKAGFGTTTAGGRR